jgi:Family of unknown function (DUF5767)
MVVREITIIKCPRNDRPEDKPISFPPLQNLHLHLMENRKKLKKGLPVAQIKKQPVKPEALHVGPYSDDMMAGKARVNIKSNKSVQKEKVSKKKEVEPKDEKKKKKKEKKEKKKTKEEVEEEDDELENELGGDEDEGEIEGKVKHDTEEEDEEMAKELGGEDEEGEDEDGDDDNKGDEPPNPDEEEDPYAHLSPEEREAQEKEEFIWRFKIMKKKYRNRDIPDFNEHDDLEVMKTTYERKLREISLDENVDSYRTYLILGFHGMEYVCTEWLGVDMKGFADQQKAGMDNYDSLLIELGEKSRTRWFSSLPVEIRLIGFIIIQAGLFYLGKIMSDKAGASVTGFFKTLAGQNAPAGGAENDTEGPRKKMRGPSVKVDDLKKKVKEEG